MHDGNLTYHSFGLMKYHDQLPQIRNIRVFIEKEGMLQKQNGYLFSSFNVTISTLPESFFLKVFRSSGEVVNISGSS